MVEHTKLNGNIMELDNTKLVNLVLEKTNQKLNQLQAQVIVLESQLQLAIDVANNFKKDLDKVRSNGKSEHKTGTG